jgi:hypothetical protein
VKQKAVISVHRFPLIGGLTALRVPFVATVVAIGALAVHAWDAAVGAAIIGGITHVLWRSMVLEVSPAGLTRGFVLGGTFLGPTTILPWASIREVNTDWCRPGDDTALETTVRSRDGTTLRFSTAMGLAPYWACLAAIADHLPRARRSGLTEATLGGGRPGPAQVLAAARTIVALALVLAALVGIHYLWAQGRSSLSRYLEEISAPVERAQPR